MFADCDLLPVSALQHLLFCERQCALIHLEQQWEDNRLTVLGRLEHERIDTGYREFRRGKRQISGLRIKSPNLGVYGRLDVLELELLDSQGSDNAQCFGLKGQWRFYPVEFKHGAPKDDNCDRIQLCAQALCLEEMLNIEIPMASLFYYRVRRREEVALDDSLRQLTAQAIKRLQQLIAEGVTPPPTYAKRCQSCSLLDLCLPERLDPNRQSRYRDTLFRPVSQPL